MITKFDLVTDEVLDLVLKRWLNSEVLLKRLGPPSNYNLSKKFLQTTVYGLIEELVAQETDLAKEYFLECEKRKEEYLNSLDGDDLPWDS